MYTIYACLINNVLTLSFLCKINYFCVIINQPNNVMINKSNIVMINFTFIFAFIQYMDKVVEN